MPKFDVLINLYVGDETLLNAVECDKCTLLNYWLYTDNDKMDCRMVLMIGRGWRI